jgi:glutathionylspermidine synthase
MYFDYSLRTKFIYLRGGRCYFLDYLGRGGYENQEYSFYLTDSKGNSYLQNHSVDWLVENIENDILIVRRELPSNLLKQIQEYVENVNHLSRLDLPDDLKNMVKVYLGNVSYNKLFYKNK